MAPVARPPIRNVPRQRVVPAITIPLDRILMRRLKARNHRIRSNQIRSHTIAPIVQFVSQFRLPEYLSLWLNCKNLLSKQASFSRQNVPTPCSGSACLSSAALRLLRNEASD
jgi:hypothetical protein